ncbi:hypothetical protein HYH03_009788 [Edaphochlamys debaryana]|uniref:Protein kinase domain-containing protein n=1 Tax=Edaphochlamys debaryana TaxID=47281 RepID=A0A836BWL4_9CHLO|nr:hypothetical protein HYH03_009788 [Edaphochlamys debaryana]|eukprot:KAG2491831.1 hypothetical protein HYH03_009788 [Edaphochlamys debaryana]
MLERLLCCLRGSAGGAERAEDIPTLETERELPRGRNVVEACNTTCDRLLGACDASWPQRIESALVVFREELGCSDARLGLLGPDGLAYVFGEEPDSDDLAKRAFPHLAEVLAQANESQAVVVVRRCGRTKALHSLAEWPAGAPLTLAPSDLLALPVRQGGNTLAAALLLGWEQPSVHVSSASAVPCAKCGQSSSGVQLTAAEVRELRRTAQFLGFGLLSEPQTARYMARVCGHVALLPLAMGLQELVCAMVEGVADSVAARFSLQAQLVLAVTHGPTTPAVLIAPKSRGLLGTAGTDVHNLLSDPCSIGGHMATRSSHTGPHVTTERSGISLTSARAVGLGSSTASGGGGDGRIRAVSCSLGHTLLQQASRGQATGNTQAIPPMRSMPRGASGFRIGAQASTQDCGTSSSAMDLFPTSRPLPLAALLVPNAGAHVLEEQQPCRDLLLCSNLTGGRAGSVVLLTEVAAVGPTGSPLLSPSNSSMLTDLPTATAKVQTLASKQATGTGTVDDRCARPASRNASVAQAQEEGGFGPRQASLSGPTSLLSGLASVQPPGRGTAPFRLGLYLLCPEALPAGVLQSVAAELQGVLPLFFTAFRAAVTSAVSELGAVGGRRAHHDWRRLQEQIMGMGFPSTPSPAPPVHATATIAPREGAVSAGAGADRLLGRAPSPAQPARMSADVKASASVLESGAPKTPVPGLYDSAPPTDAPAPAVLLGRQLALPPSAQGARSAPLSRALACKTSAGAGSLSPTAKARPQRTSSAGVAVVTSMGDGQSMPGAPGPEQHSGKGRRSGESPRGNPTGRSLFWLLSGRGSRQPQRQGSGDTGAGLGAGSLSSGPGAGSGHVAAAAAAAGAAPPAFRTLHVFDTDPHSITIPEEALMGPDDDRGSTSAPLPRHKAAHYLTAPAPGLTLEHAAAPAAGVDSLVVSMRQGLAAGTGALEQYAAQAQDLAAMQLLEVLGRGGQGVVFRGVLHGLETAVKVVTDPAATAKPSTPGTGAGPAETAGPQESDAELLAADKAAEARLRQAKRGAMELALMGTLSHPQIVGVYASFSGVVVVRCQYQDSPQPEVRLCFPDDPLLNGNDPGPLNQVMCLEFCDMGTLASASRLGAFRLPGAPSLDASLASPALVPLYTSLLEVALALRYLHSRRLVHCDVKAGNVLLKSSTRDPRGWTCKLSDFGCSRMLTDPSPGGSEPPVGFRTGTAVGTPTHMAPECFVRDSLLTPSIDVYSFGVLMFELLMGTTPYARVPLKDLPKQVVRNHLRPSFHPQTPSEYCALASRCWSSRPEHRPTAIELVGRLEQLLAGAQQAALRAFPVPPLLVPAAGGTLPQYQPAAAAAQLRGFV